mmetsp:Transcript_6556/g.7611  ORF Transcript_6556/g.7611 Transcript_6556/m.7611 type:complete len:591 (+) Transcript_6556:113-1885(+)|eukprot:CAMPEP_0198274464 /NCGR_PEP_ID=MMETSP1447-20131203/60543_1 /TAXON_ID=420782 /ORGANISM="Chaetoceros dichaeta, Strain CCMP1751" /LENGTH=590 /DNA_ID=CAMNT_0043968643 /DNA_START=99 /DNA_END=1871 /DNA_ORIENTATION=+
MGRTRSRRKVGTQSFGQNASTPPGSAPGSGSASASNLVTTERRKPVTAEEAALTVKNYRLAKELNDLRSRHRDEMKNVTKLTMDNMNLSARCREAINHADILRKELILQQKRNTEFVASGQTQANSENSTFSLTSARQEASEKTGSSFHTTFLEQKQTAKDHHADNTAIEIESDRNCEDNLLKPLTEGGFGDISSDDSLLNSPLHEQSKALSPSSISHRPHGNGLNAAFGELHSTELFQNSYTNPLPATPESENVSKDDKPFLADASEGGSVGEGSSINAFDASFSTTFPTSFKPSVLEQSLPPSEPSAVAVAFLDPFFPDTSGSHKNRNRRSRQKSGSGNKTAHGKSPPSSPRYQLHPKNGRLTSNVRPSRANRKRIDSDRLINTKSKADKSIDLFPESAMKSFEEMAVSTPPAKRKPLDENGDSFNSPPPPPSEKSGVGAARARYDAAYGDNKDDIPQSITPGCEGSEHSPTLVLKRLQQRKAKEKISTTLTDVPTNSETMSRSINEEIRKLDEIAKNSRISDPPSPPPPPQQLPITKRRNVRQPISYTEPSLTSKLRQGDVFFPREDVSTKIAIPVQDEPTRQLSVQ